MLIIKTKKDLTAYVAAHPLVLETKKAYEGKESEEFDGIKEELVKLLAVGDDSPDFGEDWEAWLTDNIEWLLGEAIDIVM